MTGEAKLKILIADDDAISRKLLQKLLVGQVDSTTFMARDGAEAWEMAQQDPPHLVLVDWMMPRMDGLQLCRTLRNWKCSHYVYIILVTARQGQDNIVEGLNAGADDYVCKPFDPHELRLRVSNGVRVIRLQEELANKNDQLVTLNQKLEEMARIDPLMKIGNRNSFYEAVERIHDRAVRYSEGYGLLVCDVDYFKLYNDTQGHQAGDRVLYQIAQAIKNNIRPSDQVFRYGGEELVVLLPEQDLTGAITSGTRACNAVRELGIHHPRGVDDTATISIGAAACAGGPDSPTWQDMVELADQALYRAKREGRNRVCQYDPERDTAASVS